MKKTDDDYPIDYLTRIYQTRKIRINTETRLRRSGLVLDFAIPVYSLIFIVIVICPTTIPEESITFLSITGSLGILIFSILSSSFNFKLRSHKMRLHYIKLDELYNKIEKAQNNEERDNIFEAYQHELNSVENHTDSDYLKTKILLQRNNKKSPFKKPSPFEYFHYYIRKILIGLLICLVFTTPIIIFLLLNYVSN